MNMEDVEDAMTITPNHDLEALGLIEELRDALRHADLELQRRCIILSEIRGALRRTETYLAARYNFELARYTIPKFN